MITNGIKHVFAALLLLLLLAAVIYSLQPRAATTDTPAQTPASATGSTKGIALVESSRIVRGNLEPLFSSLGSIAPLQRAELFSPVSGLLSNIDVAAGDKVEAGSVVAVIDTSVYAAELKEIEAEQALFKNSPAGDNAAQARRSYLTARAARLRQTIAGATLRAPIAGTVTHVCCSAGQRVAGYESPAATALLVIENFAQVYAHATIPERFISQVSIDMAARARVGAYPLEYFPLAIFPGKIAAISPTVDPQTRTFDIRILLDNADGRLRPSALLPPLSS